MPQTVLFLKSFIYSPANTTSWSKPKICGDLFDGNIKIPRRTEVVCFGMLAPRKFLQKRKKVEVFRDAGDEAERKNRRKLINEIDETGSAVSVLRSYRIKNQSLPKGLVVGILVWFKQLKKWNVVSEILEWLWIQHCWDFSEMDFLMLITAYGKQGEFNKIKIVLNYMAKKGYPPNVITHTALMEAYGIGGQYNKAEAIFRRMHSSGPEPSALTYQIILRILVKGDKFEAAGEIFETLLNDESSPLRHQKMFHTMIYMYKKARNYGKARKIYALMAERGVQRSIVTYNILMSFETNYKEVSNIYDEMQRAGIRPNVVSYTLLIRAYGKARRKEEALAVFEEMHDAGVRPTKYAYNGLLRAFAVSGMVEKALIVFKSMGRDRCTLDVYAYSSMLLAYVNASDMEGAEKFFRRIKQDGFEHNVFTYGTLIKGYAMENNLEKMMEKYEEMRVSSIKANQAVLTSIMDAYGKNKDFGSAVVWFECMKSCGLVPDQKAKNVLLSLAKTTEELMEAKELVGHVDSDANEKTGDGFPKSIIDEDEDDDYDYDY